MTKQAENPRKKIGITLPVDLIDDLHYIADENGRQLSREIERLLNLGLNADENRS